MGNVLRKFWMNLTHSHELLLKITCSGISYQYIGWPIATRRQSQKDGDGNNLETTERGEKGGGWIIFVCSAWPLVSKT